MFAQTPPRLTFRAIATGFAIGAVLTPGNIYSWLQFGMSFNMSIAAALISYALWNGSHRLGAARRWDLLENNINQTTASSAASIISAGLVAPIPALTILTGREFTFGILAVWVFTVSVTGIVIALGLRRQMLVEEKLPFPNGVATAETIREMYARGRDAIYRIKLLTGAGVLSASVKAIDAFAAKIPPLGLPVRGRSVRRREPHGRRRGPGAASFAKNPGFHGCQRRDKSAYFFTFLHPTTLSMRHFLKETDFSPAEIPLLFDMAAEFKRLRGGSHPRVLEGQSWGMIFYKNSTRTRISFEVGLHELGAHCVRLDSSATQISRGETIEDTARVMGRYLHGLVIRTFGQEIVEEFARHAGIPVVNALTDHLHPCQIYSDVFTLAERFGADGSDIGSLRGRKLAFLGDCSSNMANSWILAGALFGLEVVLGGPAAYAPGPRIAAELEAIAPGLRPHFVEDPRAAVEGADAVYTDVWVSMGDEEQSADRIRAMRPYSVTEDLLSAAGGGALFLHCMPAHPGQEVSEEVLRGGRAILFDQAENRLHMQKAILARLGGWAREER